MKQKQKQKQKRKREEEQRKIDDGRHLAAVRELEHEVVEMKF